MRNNSLAKLIKTYNWHINAKNQIKTFLQHSLQSETSILAGLGSQLFGTVDHSLVSQILTEEKRQAYQKMFCSLCLHEIDRKIFGSTIEYSRVKR